jgi:predicted nucleic acid-binding protein
MLVVDARVAVPALTGEGGFEEVGDPDLVGPPLLWSETRSALHRAIWFGAMSRDLALQSLRRLERGSVRMRNPRRFGEETWRLADFLGWARTYDAEYLALASLLGCRVVTLDGRLRRGADRLGFVVTPEEL